MSFADLEAGRPLAGRRRDLVNGRRQDPTQAVASGVFQINTAVSTFQRLVNTLGTPRDSPELREKLRKTRLQIGQLVKDTSAKLKQASEIDHTDVSASKKIADAKFAKDFQAVLKEFQKAQRLATERETACAPFIPQAVLPSSYTASEINVSSDSTPEQRALLVESRRQDVPLLDNEIVFNEAVIEEREQGIQEIQQQVGEVNETFRDLAVLVHDQGTTIDDINSNIESSHPVTSQAKGRKAWTHCLVGYVLDKRLAFTTVDFVAKLLWKRWGLLETMASDNGFYFFKFRDEAGKDHVLGEGPWLFQGRPMFLKKWKPGMIVSKEAQNSIPLWVKFHGIPLDFWNVEGLSHIVSTVGVPLQLDAPTSRMCSFGGGRMSFARVLVEVNASHSPPQSVDLLIPSEDAASQLVAEIRVEYQWCPSWCSNCRIFGHSLGYCPHSAKIPAVSNHECGGTRG